MIRTQHCQNQELAMGNSTKHKANKWDVSPWRAWLNLKRGHIWGSGDSAGDLLWGTKGPVCMEAARYTHWGDLWGFGSAGRGLKGRLGTTKPRTSWPWTASICSLLGKGKCLDGGKTKRFGWFYFEVKWMRMRRDGKILVKGSPLLCLHAVICHHQLPVYSSFAVF